MQETLKAIKTIQKTQRRIAVTTGIIMGVLMSVYFFSFATLIDHGMFGVLLVEIITSVAFVFAYIFMNPLSFRLTRLFLTRRHGKLLNRGISIKPLSRFLRVWETKFQPSRPEKITLLKTCPTQ